MSHSTPPAAPPAAPPIWNDPQRQIAFQAWLQGLTEVHHLDPLSVRSASADASFRRYFRVNREGAPSLVVMDAPPDKEDVAPFLRITALGCGHDGISRLRKRTALRINRHWKCSCRCARL